jgi:hypothetical protein
LPTSGSAPEGDECVTPPHGGRFFDHPGLIEKCCWLRDNARSGLRAKAILAPGGKPGGYIEYVPGEFACRRVNGRG